MNNLIYLGQFSIKEQTEALSVFAKQIVEGDYLNLIAYQQQVQIFWHDIQLGILESKIDKFIYQLIQQHVSFHAEVVQVFHDHDHQIYFNIGIDLTHY